MLLHRVVAYCRRIWRLDFGAKREALNMEFRESPHVNGMSASLVSLWVFLPLCSGSTGFGPPAIRDAAHFLNSSKCFLPVGSSQLQWSLME